MYNVRNADKNSTCYTSFDVLQNNISINSFDNNKNNSIIIHS